MKTIYKHPVNFDIEVIKEAAIKSWEDDAKYNPNPNNPHAYCNGFKAGCKEDIEHPDRYGITNKAPEMLEMLKDILSGMRGENFEVTEYQIEQLIKEATEL